MLRIAAPPPRRLAALLVLVATAALATGALAAKIRVP